MTNQTLGVAAERGILRGLSPIVGLIASWPLYVAAATPLDCPGVVAVPEGYELTRNATCSQMLRWAGESDMVFDLRGHHFRVDGVLVGGSNLTIRNGKITTNRIAWDYGVAAGRLSKLNVTAADPTTQFFIESGPDFTVEYCLIKDAPHIALSYYFGNGGAVRHSVFLGNGTGVSIQKSSDVRIEGNSFVNNRTGVNLWDENGFGVNDNTIQDNLFRRNERGVNVRARFATAQYGSVIQGNRILGNRFDRNESSGLVITVASACLGDCPSPLPVLENTEVSGNRFFSNGFSPSEDIGFDDGVTAPSFDDSGDPGDPEALAGVTLRGNRADRNADLGFDVYGVTDGGGNRAKLNGNAGQCDGIECR